MEYGVYDGDLLTKTVLMQPHSEPTPWNGLSCKTIDFAKGNFIKTMIVYYSQENFGGTVFNKNPKGIY